MGLDAVEMLITIERTFDIHIPNDEAAKIETVRDLIEAVHSRARHTSARACRTQRAFHRLRQAAQADLGIARPAVTPAAAWTELIPAEHRRDAWTKLQTAVGPGHLPELGYGLQEKLLLSALIVAASVSAAAAVPPEDVVLTALLGAAVAWFLLLFATSHWRIHPADSLKTVGLTARTLAPELPASYRSSTSTWDRSDVRRVVRAIIATQLSIEDSFSDDARIVADLGAD